LIAREQQPQILVVDDDDDLRAAVGVLLGDEGFSIIEAPNGRAALDYLLRAPTTPSLIVLDLNMPAMAGREMVNVLQSHQHLAAIPVLVVTGEALPDGSIEGSVGRLQKPYTAADLVVLVRRHASTKRQ
jgi:CheY-like chemotaxis protein